MLNLSWCLAEVKLSQSRPCFGFDWRQLSRGIYEIWACDLNTLDSFLEIFFFFGKLNTLDSVLENT